MVYFHSFSLFFHMGGYAAYVWPAFGIAIVILFVNGITTSGRLRKMIKTLRDHYACTP